jgi:argininosuccinate lyase
MPQKKNPDVPELVRGKSGRVFGDLMALLTLMKALPLAYNRDMQEDKEPLFNTVDTLQSCLGVLTAMLPQLEFKPAVMQAATESGFLNATDLADYLAAKGVPFREAHAVAGKAVAFALQQQKELHDLGLNQLQAFSTLIEADIFEALTTKRVVDRRQSYGGTATAQVKEAIAAAAHALGMDI